LNKKKKWNTGN